MSTSPEQLEEDLKSKLNKFTTTFNEGMEKVLTPMNKMAKEMMAISTPKSKKDITINGKNGYVSLLADGRVMINTPSMDDAQFVYDYINGFNKVKVSWWKKLFK